MSKELTFSAPVELTDAELDAVGAGDCKIGEPGLVHLADQLAFFVTDPPPIPGPDIFTHANIATGGCLEAILTPPT